MLQRFGYAVLEANNADEAIEIQRTHIGPIEMLISDISLPGRCSGTQVALELKAALPNLKVLFTSGTPVNIWGGVRYSKRPTAPYGNIHDH
jgi:two-component system cell cycle sensor histidine kinase/response regulator CckA